MSSTPREIVTRSLTFDHPERLPRDLWLLPWASSRFPDTIDELNSRFPSDFARPPSVYNISPLIKGSAFAAGEYVDEWGCVFINVQEGVVGEVKAPILPDISEWTSLHTPLGTLPAANTRERVKARDTVNRFCESTDKFVLADCGVRPWERYQFLRGTVEAMMDIARPDTAVSQLLKKVHEFYLAEVEFWISTDVDAIPFADDWGGQDRLLVSPEMWRSTFKPFYRDYCDLAHSSGKFAFMHSDGFILPIYEELIEVGVDAINSQLFCMDMAELAVVAKGKITFWGEIDRQRVLPSEDPQAGRDAVREVAKHLYDPSGGVISQIEFGPGANPQTAIAVYEEWEAFHREAIVNA